MKEIILIKIGEIVLKGLNKRSFEKTLINNIKYRIRKAGNFEIKNAQSTIYIIPSDDESDLDTAIEIVKKIFGIAKLSRCACVDKDINKIKECAYNYLKDKLPYVSSFKVEAKRSDKLFPMKSPDICRELGGYLLERFKNLKVDVHNPEITVTVEIRDFGAYVRYDDIKGAGGIPVGTSGKAMVLISGGIDSPVASFMLAKRGLELNAIHFVSPPYTSERAEDKVKRLLEKVAEYSGRIKLFIVPFTEIQESIKDNCKEELFTIIMRRFMMKISSSIAKREECKALITGESLGQVASQTLLALGCTDEASDMIIFRPLIGMDKDEIVTISRKIDTFDISIEPYEDCCTVFTPKHPRTKPSLKFVKIEEAKLNMDELIDKAIENTRVEIIK